MGWSNHNCNRNPNHNCTPTPTFTPNRNPTFSKQNRYKSNISTAATETLLGHSKRVTLFACKNQTIEKCRDPSHFLASGNVDPKRPFPATKRAFEVHEGRTDVSTSRYERIVKFDKVFVTGVEVFVTSYQDFCT